MSVLRKTINWLIHEYYIANPRVRRAITRVLDGGAPRRVPLLGVELQIDPVHEHGYLRASRLARRSSVFRDEVSVLMAIAAILPLADAFVDIGANVGLFSATLAKLRHVYPIHYYAFEAHPGTYQRLAHNVAGLGVETHQIALSDHAGEKVFVAGAVSHVFTAIEHRSRYSLAETMNVPCRRLDSFTFEGRRLVLKIDVEGQELEVLKGGSALFEAGRVRAVYVDGFKDHGVTEFLASYGFRFHDGRTLAPASARVYSLLALKEPPA